MKNIYIIDAVCFLFRSYFAIQGMTNKKGRSTNALYGFIRSIQKIIKDFLPQHLVAVFDGPNNKEKRVEIYKDYKSNREKMPEDLAYQLQWAHHYCISAGIPYIAKSGVEADDVIGTIAKWAEKEGAEVFICSSDKDFCQLISDKIFILNTHKDNLIIDSEKVKEMHGVTPEQIIDYLAIMGDKSDNIPGIPGFGPKTAACLLQEYGTLEKIFNDLAGISNRKWAKKLCLHKSQAFISQQLATLILDVPVPVEKNFYHIKSPKLRELNAFYQDMNFSTLLQEIETPQNQTKQSECSYTIIDDKDSLKSLIKKLAMCSSICIDTKTDQLSHMDAQMIGIGFCIDPGIAWYVPANGSLGLDYVIQQIKPVLENLQISFYGHNIKYDLHVLKNHEIDLKMIDFDTMIASYLCAPENNRHGLDILTLEKFGKVKNHIEDLIGRGKNQKSMKDIPIEKVGYCCCENVDYTCRLKAFLEEEIKNRGLLKIFTEVELPLIPVLVSMERYGLYLDTEKLNHMSELFREELICLEKDIFALAKESFNIKSPKQLSKILFEKLAIPLVSKKKSTRAEVLQSLKGDYPICGKILDYRGLEKLRSTYTKSLSLQVNSNTKRIHSTFVQTVTATGRLSSQDPNLQNIPIRTKQGRKIREAFIPEMAGWSYLAADYSQIELRLLAHLSKDLKLLNAFKHNKDIHASTAATIFDVPLKGVTKEMRAGAKAVNFGIIYGQQAYGLSQELGIDMKKASIFIEKYFNRYPGVQNFIDNAKNKVRQKGYAETLFGRKRPIPEIHSTNSMIRSAAERLAVNTPLQGTQADIIKKAMIQIETILTKQRIAYMILQIHDELIFELPDKMISSASKIIKSIMENITTLAIPLIVNIDIGKNWGEC